MNTAFDSLTHKMQRAALGKTVDLVLSHAEKDPAKTVGQIVPNTLLYTYTRSYLRVGTQARAYT